MMVFSVICPTDGSVEVGLEDIDSIIVRDEDNVEVLFTCPVCGGNISVSAQVPRVLLTALEDSWHAVDEDGAQRRLRFTMTPVATPGEAPEPVKPRTPEEEERLERYVEYFRRQLEAAASADAILAEIDGDR